MSLTNRLLPAAGNGYRGDARTGAQSTSRGVPSKLTVLSDRAALENNELPQVQPGRS